MKINKISSCGTVAIKSVEIDCNAPITLICAHNRGGKTSLRDGIIHAFTGEHPKAKLKKNYPLLINRDGGNSVGYTYIDYDSGKRACITLPSAVHELTDQLPSALPFVIDPALFGSITPDERRSFLFDLVNLRSDGEEVKIKLVERGCDDGRIDQIMPFLKSSFANAHKHAEENVKQTRVNWKAVTGEVYGSLKAEKWAAHVPAVDPNAKISAENALAKVDRELAEANQVLGALQARMNGANQKDAEIARLTELAEKADRIRQKLDIDKKQVQERIDKVEQARAAALGSKPGAIACACPACGTELVFDGKKLTERGGDLHGDEYMAAKLTEYENSLKMVKNAVANGERDLAASTAAREQLTMIKNTEAAPSEGEIIEAKAKTQTLKCTRDRLQDDLTIIGRNVRLANEAELKTQKAAAHHADVKAWDQIASALAPDGIPGEMLGAALKPANDRIAASVGRLNFSGNVKINDDMTIMEDDYKLYALASKSTKLLIDSVIAEAISFVSGIRFFMVDEFDLFDMPSRIAYLGWLIDLAENNEIDSVIIFGTLKEKPVNLPTEVGAFWIDSGVIA